MPNKPTSASSRTDLGNSAPTTSSALPKSLSSYRLVSMAIDKSSSPEVKALKEQFAAFDLCADKRTAAVFGYLLAKEQTEPQPEEATAVYDKVCALLELYEEGEYGDVTNAADKLFGIIYKWLDKQEGLDKDVLQDVFASCLPPVDG